MLRWDVSKDEAQLIHKIVKRAQETIEGVGGEAFSLLEATMDVQAVHCNGTPLRLHEWLEAPVVDFMHDFNGIRQHIDRSRGALRNCFVPRFAVPERGKARA